MTKRSFNNEENKRRIEVINSVTRLIQAAVGRRNENCPDCSHKDAILVQAIYELATVTPVEKRAFDEALAAAEAAKAKGVGMSDNNKERGAVEIGDNLGCIIVVAIIAVIIIVLGCLGKLPT